MKNLILLGILFLTISFGCQEFSVKDEELEVANRSGEDSLFVVQKGPFHFSILIPKMLVQREIPIVLYQETTGKLIISAGDGFILEGSQEIKEVSDVKEKLMREDILVSTISEISKDHILYKQSLPYGKDYSWHCKFMTAETQLPYFFESSLTHQFTLDQVKVMLQSLKSISSL